MKNKNTEYEILVKSVYESLLREEGIDTVIVKHNLLLKGISGLEHQVDVYWEFVLAGELHKVAIECKNYSASVPIGKIRDFHSVLNDIGGIKGILVSKKGFQSGTVEYARKYGISLKLIREPEDNDWKGFMRDLCLNIVAYFKTNIKRHFMFDQEYLTANYRKGDKIIFDAMTNEIFVDDRVENHVISLYDLQNSLDSSAEGRDFVKQFEYEDAYLICREAKIKIKCIKFIYDVESLSKKYIIEGSNLVKAVIIDPNDNISRFVRK